jgi:uncharacterized protein (TIGR00369 family)
MAATTSTREPHMTTPDIPEGFERHTRKSPLTDPWEPLYSKRTDKAVIIALRLAKPHTNGRGLIHGGLIAALADNAMGHSCAHCMGGVSSLVTIGLAVDFVGTAEVGQWLAVESDVVKTGRTICFAQSLIKADGVVIARANATFRVVPKKARVLTKMPVGHLGHEIDEGAHLGRQ